MAKEITLKGKNLKVGFDAVSYYRFGSKGGRDADLCQLGSISANIDSATVFASLVLLLWAVLKEESQVKYSSPE